MKPVFKPIIGALVFAMLIIACAYFLKGTAAKDWVKAVLYGLGFYLLFRYSMALPKNCCHKTD